MYRLCFIKPFIFFEQLDTMIIHVTYIHKFNIILEEISHCVQQITVNPHYHDRTYIAVNTKE